MLVIKNIAQLVLPTCELGAVVNTCNIETVEDARVEIDRDTIVNVGVDNAYETPESAEVVDAGGACVVPGLIDCHTHTIFAGTREDEFVQRIQGVGYVQIAEKGGGIKTTVNAVRKASVDELIELALPRLDRMLRNGVTTVEIKSGYGLSRDDEVKMLHAARQLDALQPIDIVPTFLAAHTIPEEYMHKRSAYVELVTSDDFLGYVADEHLAEFCDVFCERSAFDVEESRTVLLAGKERGLVPTLHADQITQMGASRLAAEVGAVSADHLETIDDGGIAAMKDAGVIAVLLPGCSFFLGVGQAPARRIIDAGLPVAIATDYNPGSSMVESLPLVMAIACTQMHMTPAEVIIATTVNAAAKLNRADIVGSVREGMKADLVILDVANYNQWPYNAGRSCVRCVIKNGKLVYRRQD